MVITQLGEVKNLPYLVSNAMALLTCLPLAIGIVAFGKPYIRVFENKMFTVLGEISYEIYLVHAFTLALVMDNFVKIIVFVTATFAIAVIADRIIRKIKV